MPGLDKRYRLSSGTQVRQENFGLLFYTMRGPRLYFLPTGTILNPHLFNGECSLSNWLENKGKIDRISDQALKKIEKSLDQLIDKGVLLEC